MRLVINKIGQRAKIIKIYYANDLAVNLKLYLQYKFYYQNLIFI